MNEVLKNLYERKSVRDYLDKEISQEDKLTILEAAVNAPTAGNQQFYSIIDVTRDDLKARLSDSCDHQDFIKNAKMLLVFCVDLKRWYDAFELAGANPSKPSYGDFVLATEDAMAAAENAVTAAESLGIGSCYIGDILENFEVQKEILGLPKYVYPYSMLVFGYPTQQQMERQKPKRFDLQYVVHENTYKKFSDDEIREMFKDKTASKGFDAWLQYFCKFKYDSDFATEMDRSVGAMLKDLSE